MSTGQAVAFIVLMVAATVAVIVWAPVCAPGDAGFYVGGVFVGGCK